MRHLHPRDVTQICRVSLGHYCMYAAEQTFRGWSRNRSRNKWKLECRTEGWEARRGNRNVLLHDEELINVFQPSCSCSFVCTQTRHRAQRHRPTRRPTDRELKIHVAIHRGPCVYRWRGHSYAFPLFLSTSVCLCVYMYVLCNNRISASSPGEERYRPLKAIYFSDHLPKAGKELVPILTGRFS